jgi:spore maturation protein CgeB
VVLNQDTFYVDTALMRRIKSIGRPILIGQVGISPTRGEDWRVYDLLISQLAATVNFFRSFGVRAEVVHLAFEPSVIDALPAPPPMDVDISFVGTVSADHQQRIALLEAIARGYDLKLFGNITGGLPDSSPLHRCFQGEAWGVEMYQTLRRSRIVLNSHIDMVGREAGNARLFEATGVGAFLLTDFKDNLHTLFEPGREAAAWRSIDNCVAQIQHYLADDAARREISSAGRRRTLAEHNYRERTRNILAFVEKL